jgi:cyclic pyranopterin phosphate synthase
MLTHVNKVGKAVMVNVQNKTPTLRTAIAQCIIKVPNNIYTAVLENTVKKGDVIAVSRLSGIISAKKTSELIPLCHQINLNSVEISIESEKKNEFLIMSEVNAYDKTGVEMEALVAVNITALTFYDMCKALSKDMVISETRLIEKRGGKSDYNPTKI